MNLANRFGYCTVLLLLLGGCSSGEEQPPQLLGRADNCDAAIRTCTVESKGLRAALTLGPDVKPLVAFPIQLVIEGAQSVPQNVVVDFQMQGMDMGMNRYRLIAASPTSWQGNATLPVCTASRMDWLATVDFTLDEQRLRLIYPFSSELN